MTTSLKSLSQSPPHLSYSFDIYIDYIWSTPGEIFISHTHTHTLRLYKGGVISVNSSQGTLGQSVIISKSKVRFIKLFWVCVCVCNLSHRETLFNKRLTHEFCVAFKRPCCDLHSSDFHKFLLIYRRGTEGARCQMPFSYYWTQHYIIAWGGS